MSLASDGTARRIGFGAELERAPTPRPVAIDRLAAFALGAGLRALDVPAWNRLSASTPGSGARQAALELLADDALAEQVHRLCAGLRRRGLERRALPQALEVVAEVARRSIGLRAHPEQRAGAALMLSGMLVEMDTGEGKSLTGALAAAVAAASGLPVEVFTVNEYLACRDAAAFAPFFARLGLGVATIKADDSAAQRAAALTADVLYVVNKDYVFEYLRYRAASAGKDPFAGRGLCFAIVDEADSILVDEARTPLILAQESTQLDERVLRAVAEVASQLAVGSDYTVDRDERRATLRVESLTRVDALRDAGFGPAQWPDRLLRELVEQALVAREFYRRDRDYIVQDERIAIVDEYTGRVLADRSWERGLHQFIEIAEGLAPSPVRETLARTTFPEFFRKYMYLAGASGTLAETAPELMAVYGVRVARVPTHRPARRHLRGPIIYRNSNARWRAVEREVLAGLARGQAVLVGTRSVAASEEVERRLRAAGIEPALLNARSGAAESEAHIVAEAGRSGRVTVATNRAGRGTDICIDDSVRAAGGLLVVLTELHESMRIDRQLLGRCARQGDPGQCVLLASLEDELFRQYLPLFSRRFVTSDDDSPPLGGLASRLLRRAAQALAESRHRADRASVLERNEALARQLGFAGGTR